MNFLDINFPHSREYSSDEAPIPLEFYLDILPKSKVIYLKLGYFSSKAIQVLSYGFAQFIYNGGVIKIITNHFLYKNDMELLENDNISKSKAINEQFINDLKWIHSSLSGNSQHFFNCLKYLVKQDKLELIPVVLRPNRMAHYKQGIFIDDSNNIVFIDGSCNFTANGLLENGENLSICRSWGSDFEKSKVNKKRSDIELIIKKKNNNYSYLSKSHILNAVSSIGEDKNINELLDNELKILKIDHYKEHIKNILLRHGDILTEQIKKNKLIPKFPFNSSPRDYQIEAYELWKKNGKQGIFAMATGTGKTITSLNCLLNEYLESGSYQAIIVVPTKILLNQWNEEALSFNFKNIILVSSEYDWKPLLSELLTSLFFKKNNNFIVIVTYSTLGSDYFSRQLKKFPSKTIFIADEAHNIGSTRIKKLLPELKFDKRIALSATPKRAYDPDGNELIEKYFKSSEPYTFSFSMEKAIKEDILCEYEYYPHIVSLNDEEMYEYAEISKKLLKYFDFDTKQLKKIKAVEILLQERKRIIHKASDKLRVFQKVIKEHAIKNAELKYTFVYAPEGSDNDGNNLLDLYMHILEKKHPSSKAYPYTHHTANKDEIMKNFEEGYTDVLFSMKCLDEGVDIPRAELAIFCSSTGNPRQFIQRRGRVLRKHKDKIISIIHDLVVIPPRSSVAELYQIEKNLIRSELIRVVHFASLAKNYYNAMEVCSNVATLYELDMYALEAELRGDK